MKEEGKRGGGRGGAQSAGRPTPALGPVAPSRRLLNWPARPQTGGKVQLLKPNMGKDRQQTTQLLISEHSTLSVRVADDDAGQRKNRHGVRVRCEKNCPSPLPLRSRKDVLGLLPHPPAPHSVSVTAIRRCGSLRRIPARLHNQRSGATPRGGT